MLEVIPLLILFFVSPRSLVMIKHEFSGHGSFGLRNSFTNSVSQATRSIVQNDEN